MTNPIIQLTDISASYDEKTVLSHVNLTVYERDFLGVIGPNGGGKTTLIKIILGLLKPASGSVRFYKNEKEVPEIAMGYLPQYNSIDKKFPISVYEVVLSGLNKQKSLFHRYTPTRCFSISTNRMITGTVANREDANRYCHSIML